MRLSMFLVLFTVLPTLRALAEAPAAVGVVSNVSVVSNHVTDVSSLEAWKRNTIRDGMTDQEKAIAIFRTVVAFEHEVAAPAEFTQHSGAVTDAIKTFNVYGYNLCGPGASHVVELARYCGMKARGWNINGHSVAEIWYDGAWHMFDASYINYFPREDGVVASVEEIMADVKAWYDENPGYLGEPQKLAEFRRADNFTQWKAQGPPLLARSPFFSGRGVYPAGLMDWHQAMRHYDGKVSFEYETPHSMGYRVNIQLRPGEKLLRRWSHRDLHINIVWQGRQPWVNMTPGEGSMRYTPEYGDHAPGRVGNGGIEYIVPVADAQLRYSALRYENLRVRGEGETGPVLTVDDPEKDGILELRMNSPYVFLGGAAALKSVSPDGTSISVGISDNNGGDWMEHPLERQGDDLLVLSRAIHRRYDYRLRFTIRGQGAGLDALRLIHDIQHSQRALPILLSGENTIRFSAGPEEGTVTVEPSLNSDASHMQLTYRDFSPTLEGIDERSGGGLGVEKESGALTFPIETPGDMTRLRIFSAYRARDAKDGWTIEASFDDGKTWTRAGECPGQATFGSSYLTVEPAPPGARRALVRWTGRQTNATMLFNLRLDADYAQPHGGFRPIRITYIWEEDGQEKTHAHIARHPEETYTITCGDKTVCKSVMLEVAESLP